MLCRSTIPIVANLGQSAIRESWQRTLEGIPTLIGRIAYLASLRDPNSGRYQHFGLAQRMGETAADALLRECHAAIFLEWLGLNYASQRSQLTEYLESIDGDAREIFSNWLRLEPYQRWLPAESRETERALFLADLASVSELIRADYGFAFPDRDS